MKLIRSTLVTTQVTSENIKYQVTTKGTQESKDLVNNQGTPGSKDQVTTKATDHWGVEYSTISMIAHRIIRLEKVITICVS